MRFADLTWNEDQLSSDGVTLLGWQAQLEGENGVLAMVNTIPTDTETEIKLTTATGVGQLYQIVIFAADRQEGAVDEFPPVSEETNCTSNRVDTLLQEAAAIPPLDPPAEETTTTTTASGQWD
jgi:hypothetical protein